MLDKDCFVKSHGLGNDYIVIDTNAITFPINERTIKLICDVHYGIGSDGILLVVPSKKADYGVRIFNPDGSEAEKSGNGLRIIAKFLYDYGYIKKHSFTIETIVGNVNCTIDQVSKNKASVVTVDIGKANFLSLEIPVKIDKSECINEPLNIDGKEYKINCVSVGNPHCVIIKENLDEAEIKKFGALIENHPLFPKRINVQFAKIINRSKVQILIWERGAGYTLASGSSSSAVAAVMHKLGYVDNEVEIIMPGGSLHIKIDNQWNIYLKGEVKQIAEGKFSDELIDDLIK